MSNDISSFTISPINHEVQIGDTEALTLTIVVATQKAVSDGYIEIYINNSNVETIQIGGITGTYTLTYNYTFQNSGTFNIYAKLYGRIIIDFSGGKV